MRAAVFALLVGAALTAAPLGRAHRPIAIALWLALVSAAIAAAPLPRDVLIAVALVPPVAVAGAAWGALQRSRSWLLLSAIAWVLGGAAVGGCPLAREQLGSTYALAWLSALLVGAVACHRPRAPRSTRITVVALIAGLAPEAIAWLAWGADVDGGYAIVRAASLASLAVVVIVQVKEARRRWIDSTRISARPASRA